MTDTERDGERPLHGRRRRRGDRLLHQAPRLRAAHERRPGVRRRHPRQPAAAAQRAGQLRRAAHARRRQAGPRRLEPHPPHRRRHRRRGRPAPRGRAAASATTSSPAPAARRSCSRTPPATSSSCSNPPAPDQHNVPELSATRGRGAPGRLDWRSPCVPYSLVFDTRRSVPTQVLVRRFGIKSDDELTIVGDDEPFRFPVRFIRTTRNR